MKTYRLIFLFAAVIMTFILLVWYAGPWSQDTTESLFPQATANQVVAAIQSGRLKPDATGIVILPPSLASASKNGKVYVTKNGSGATIIFFPNFLAGVWFSSDSNYEGYLYCSAAPPASCHITGPVLASRFYTRTGNWTAGQTEFDLQYLVKVRPNWYQVETPD